MTFNISFASPEDIITHIRDGLYKIQSINLGLEQFAHQEMEVMGIILPLKKYGLEMNFVNLYPPTNLHEEAISSTAFKCNWDSPHHNLK
ncbi:MAG: hypothetical protein IPI52_01345 [Bacteroidetes bacterium]|nr:hypothetical protein [Bacteroidota bacterium]